MTGVPRTSTDALPSRAAIEAWDSRHLYEAAARWRASAAMSEEGFRQHQASVSNLDWTGEARDTAVNRMAADAAVVDRQNQVQRASAEIAEGGAHGIESAKREALEAISHAESNGFRVRADLSVTDTSRVDLSTAAARYRAAAEHAEEIRWYAERLVQADTFVGKRLAEKAVELECISFEGEHESHASGDRTQLVGNEIKLNPPQPPAPQLSPSRQAALEYSEKWAEGFNPDYESLGGGDLDCTNFASQVMRAGGFGDVGNGIDDWRRGDSDDWYYQNDGLIFPHNTSSKTWTLAKESHNFVTQHSGRGEIVGVVPTPSRDGLDPLAPSRAGLLPGDLIYYKDADGNINHVAVYAGQTMMNGVPTDVINQHSGGVKLHGDWMPDSAEYTQAPAQVEFVHLRYPGE